MHNFILYFFSLCLKPSLITVLQSIIQIYYNMFNLFRFAGVIGCFQGFSTTNKILAHKSLIISLLTNSQKFLMLFCCSSWRNSILTL